EKNDAPRTKPPDQPIGHRNGVLIAPILAVQVPVDHLVPKPEGVETRRKALGTVRGAKQPLSVRGKSLLAGANLLSTHATRKGRKGRMVPGMIADDMTRIEHPAYHIRVLPRRLANHEKGRSDLMLLQDPKQSRRVLSVRSIVKCQSGNE